MSFGISAVAWMAGAAIAGTALGAVQANKAAKAQSAAQNLMLEQARKQAQAAEEAAGIARRKKPDVSAIMEAAAAASKTGIGSTMLTGPGGVDPSTLTLGKNSLLGGG